MILNTLYYKNKIVCITGAGAGIGRALCHQLCELGATVIATDINFKNVQETVYQLGVSKQHLACAKQLDVSDKAAFVQLKEFILEQYGRIDLVINNAGIGTGGCRAHCPRSLKSWDSRGAAKRNNKAV